MNEPQASLTPTPETDEAIAEVEQHGSVFPLIKHARRLERQRDKLVRALEDAVAEFDEWEGPEEPESSHASKARNRAVRVYEGMRAALAEVKGKS